MSARIIVAVGLNSSSTELNENKEYLLRSYHLLLYLVSVVTRQRIKQISYWWLKYCQLDEKEKKKKKNEERLEKLKALLLISPRDHHRHHLRMSKDLHIIFLK